MIKSRHITCFVFHVTDTTGQVESFLYPQSDGKYPLVPLLDICCMFLVSSSWAEQMSRKKRRTRQIWTHSPSAPSRYSYPWTSRDCCFRVKKLNYLYMLFHVSGFRFLVLCMCDEIKACYMFRVSCYRYYWSGGKFPLPPVRWKVPFGPSACLTSIACFVFQVPELSRCQEKKWEPGRFEPTAPLLLTSTLTPALAGIAGQSS